jgi:hypothetical protein
MSRKKTIFVTLSILLAVGAPLVSALKMAQQFKDYPSIRVDIEPYDPRDLLYGHYMQFQTTWNWKENAGPGGTRVCDGDHCCLCVDEGDVNPEVSLSQCPAKGELLPGCHHTLRGTSWGNTNFENGVHRYYVDEKIAKPLEDLFVREKKKFSLDLHITPAGKSLPGQLYVDGLPLKEFIAKNGGIIPASQTP